MLEDIDKSEVKLTVSIILHKQFLRKKVCIKNKRILDTFYEEKRKLSLIETIEGKKTKIVLFKKFSRSKEQKKVLHLFPRGQCFSKDLFQKCLFLRTSFYKEKANWIDEFPCGKKTLK